ncbi:MAG TPA: exodeoxyribonuclease VII small subunit [Alphaproteobacteria bacterium]|nr:exodeoxyribonuclease VII small subunit [Rhodospirillaceae bacterium]HRJ12984.1 exodeoxyribonuclease VII small subunit [Alphaproteobacteria bacterium]
MSKAAAKNTALASDLTFEKAMQELDGIVKKLESGQGSLDDAIENYEKGAQLRAFCEEKLKAAELRISQIQSHADGKITATKFADTKEK